MAHTTLILGAGLGTEYGYPDGSQLRIQIIDELREDEIELKNILKVSQAQTVDEIAARFPSHAENIRQIVARIIRNAENDEKLFRNTKDNTYKILLKQIALAQESGNTFDIITFNYDRSLQHLVNEVNKIELDPIRKIDLSRITPIYGRLSPLNFEDLENSFREISYHKYGVFPEAPDGVNHEYWELQCLRELYRTSNIAFIDEEKFSTPIDPGPKLEESNQIFFLGVGYHKSNMDILNFDFGKTYSNKIIAGTGLNLSPDEISFLKEQYPAIDTIENCHAHSFLSNKFDINQLEKNLTKKKSSILNVL